MLIKVMSFDPKKKSKIQVGLLGNGTFYRRVTVEHFMRCEQGYGIQEDVVEFLVKENCKKIVIDTGLNIYDFTMEQLLAQKPKDYSGHGLQRFLCIRPKQKHANLSI